MMINAVRKFLFNPTCQVIHSKGRVSIKLDKVDQSIINKLALELKPYGLFVCPLGVNNFYIKGKGHRVYAAIKRGDSINITISL